MNYFKDLISNTDYSQYLALLSGTAEGIKIIILLVIVYTLTRMNNRITALEKQVHKMLSK